MAAIALGLGASFLWGVSDFVGGVSSRRLSPFVVVLGSQLIALAVLAPIVLLSGAAAPPAADVAIAAGAGAFGVAGLGLFYQALAIGTMGIVAPIGALAVAVPVLYGLLSGETPSAVQLAGIAVAAAGIALATRGGPEGDGSGASAAVRRTSIVLALAAALGFGAFYIGTDHAAEASTEWTLLGGRVGEVALALAVVAALRPAVAAGGSAWRALVWLGLADLGATACFVFATRQGLLPVVSTLAALYPVVTVLLARAVLDERLTATQAAGVVVAFAGVAAIAAG